MQLFRTRRAQHSIGLMSILLAFPLGAELRQQVDARADYPYLEPVYSDLVDADPAEADLNRYVVSGAKAEKLAKSRHVTEAVEVSPGRVAIATSLGKKRVGTLDGVTAVENDPISRADVTDPSFPQQWGLRNTGQSIYGTPGLPGADTRWVDARAHTSGTGVVVAVIDSGIDFSHPDLKHALWTNPGEVCGNAKDDDGNGWDFVNNDNQQYDLTTATGDKADNVHGTHVSGIIAAAADNGLGVAGIAPGVKIMPLKIMENGTFPTSRSSRAVNYAVANGADIINMSWGGTTYTVDQYNAVKNASDKGVLMAASAGNVAKDNDTSPRYPSAHDVPGMIAVGASTNTDQAAAFSCWGATRVDLHAPGNMVLATIPNGGYAYLSGTSMAAPHVAATAALLRSRTPGMNVGAVRSAILGSVDKLDSLAGKTVTGGRLDIASALGISEEGAQVVFNDFHAFNPRQEHTGEVIVSVPDGTLPLGADVTLNASLGVVDGGYLRGVIDHPVNDGATDADAQVLLSSGPLSTVDKSNMANGGVAFPMTTALPPGDYAVMVELVNEDEAGRPVIGSPSMVLFSVIDPTQPSPAPTATTTDPGTGTTNPGTGTTQPAPTTSDPAPTTTDPGTGTTDPGTGTTQPAPTTADPVTGTTQPVPTSPEPGTSQPAPTGPAPVTSQPAPVDSGPVTSQPAPDEPKQTEPKQTAPKPAPDDDYTPIAPPPDIPAPTVPGDGPAPKQPEDWRVTPNTGSTDGGEYVVVNGTNLPDNAYVLFGATNGHVVYQDDNGVQVKTPAHLPGKVDVTVFNKAGEKVVLPGAYTFVSDSPSGGITPSGPSDPGTSDPTAPGTGTTDPGTSDPGTGTTDPGTTGPAPSDTGTTPPPPTATTPPPDQPVVAPPAEESEPKAVRRTAGTPYTTSTGLKADAFVYGHPLSRVSSGLWSGSACRAASCAGIRL